ncbi:zinc-finger-containing protein [Henriciella aquimarina]|uniref:zinc-finger-containing protein n=1 Tax=Henriciella aquimarina TaxID=545261 RepID=UPI000A05AFD0|nr:zinc-finger-containing protein [Henriciella aquimarina]
MCSKPFPCAECGGIPAQTTGRAIYPHRPDLFHKFFYLCGCGAYVGCHPGTEDPLGRPAHAELRKARGQVHKVLDRIWMSAPNQYERGGKLTPQQLRSMARKRTYRFLADRMKLTEDECHTAMFDIEQCREGASIMSLRMTFRGAAMTTKSTGPTPFTRNPQSAPPKSLR